MLATPLVLDHDVRQYDVSDSGPLVDVLIYIVYDADVEDVDVVVASICAMYDVDVANVAVVIYVVYVVYSDDGEDDDVVVVVIYVVKVDVLAANDEKARMNLRIFRLLMTPNGGSSWISPLNMKMSK